MKTAKYSEDKRAIVIKFDYNPKLVTLVKTLANRKWHPMQKYWTALPSKSNINILNKHGFSLCSFLNNKINNNTPKKEKESLQKYIKPIKGLKGTLYPFQAEGVGFLEKFKGRALISDPMGSGKTLQTLAYLQAHPEIRPAVVICPASVKLNWEKETKQWTTIDDIHVLYGRKAYMAPKNDDKGIYIINYDIIGGLKTQDSWLRFLINNNIKCVILDETHFIKNHKTLRYKSIKDLVSKTKHIIGLSGTPLTNRPIELFNVLNFINPKEWYSRWKFASRYCGLKKGTFGWDMTGATHIDELHERLTDPDTGFMIRRKKEDVLPELPSKTRAIIPIEIDNKKEYKKAEADLIAYLHENYGKKAAAKAKIAKALVEFEKLKQLAVKGKMKQAIDWIQDYIDTDEKLVVFTTHIFVLNTLQNHFNKTSVRLDGGTSAINRKKAVDAFVQNDNIKLFLGNRQAAGTGINDLQLVCSTSCFLELGWTPGEHDQAEDRLHRINQTNKVTAYYLIAVDTVEDKLVKMLDKKRKIIDKVLDGKDSSADSLLTELMDDYLTE